MNSMDPASLIFSESLTIPDLIKLMKHSFHEREFDDIQNILMDHEKTMRHELNNLIKTQQGLRDVIKIFEERQKKVNEENSKLRTENQKLIAENERLKQKSLENQQLLGVRLVSLEKVIGELVDEKFKFTDDQIIKDLKQKQLEAAQFFDEMKANVDMAPELKKCTTENLVECSEMNKGTRDTVQGSSDLAPDCHVPQAESNGANKENESERLQGSNIGSKALQDSVHVIEINDSDDSNHIPLSEWENKRVRAGECKESPIASGSKKRRRECTSSKTNSATKKKENHGPGSTGISIKPILDPESDDSSACSDSYIENLVARAKKLAGKK